MKPPYPYQTLLNCLKSRLPDWRIELEQTDQLWFFTVGVPHNLTGVVCELQRHIVNFTGLAYAGGGCYSFPADGVVLKPLNGYSAGELAQLSQAAENSALRQS